MLVLCNKTKGKIYRRNGYNFKIQLSHEIMEGFAFSKYNKT